MRKLTVSTLASLDGVIQDPGGFGETDQGGWANQYFTDQAQQEALDRLLASDYFLMGRTTYELMYRSWGNVKGGGPYLDRTNEIPKLVASRTLTGSLPWNATVIQGDVAEEIAKLKQQTGGDIEVYGSSTLVQTLMKHNLIDEYRVAVHPLVLGGGTRLFVDGGVRTTLQLSEARKLESGVVELVYLPAGKE
ncbi:dihydrofolate reductase family protein [Kribbella monticola]|uniref:dihydrofolate reductase family protein n=1 Tax=Kribbella monticola TaxID=2185285 RepID=UPI000DD2FD79|nr:dihydrofolate reductase family protein [Kribbella monticola]